MTEEKYLTGKELAKVLGIHPRTVRRMAADGRIPYLDIGGYQRFKLADVHAALEKQKQKEKKDAVEKD